MQERRRNKRTELDAKLLIERLDDGAYKEVEIEVTDLSKAGMGFICGEILHEGSVYESRLTIWTKEVLHCFLKVVRVELKEGGSSYGAIFIGMAETDVSRIQCYQTIRDYDAETGA
jgi:hypothetical protein